jgi:hypothetical protein
MKTLSRRAMLRGTGAALGMPLLEAMLPSALAEGAVKPPVRMCFYVVGGGAYLPYWTLDGSARNPELEPKKAVEHLGPPAERNETLETLSPTLEPLERFKKDILLLGGLTLSGAFGFEDGHSAEIGALLTGAIFSKEKLQCGISVDQVAARTFEGKTWLDALVIGLNGGRPGGAKGLGRVYAQHYSWRSATTPTGEERNPRLVFDRLFRSRLEGGPARRNADLDADRRSVLDSALDEAKRLQSSLGGSDRHKLDEYLTSVRDVEKRIEFASKRVPDADAPAFNAGDLQEIEGRIPPEKGIPESYADYDRLMIDLIALAFQTDTTRVAMLSHTGYRAYPEVGVKRGHHDLQHHEGDPEKREDLRKIDRYNVGLYSAAIEKLDSIKEGEGSLLDNSMLMYGSGMSNGNRHSRENLPILLAGRGGGTLKPGRCIDFNWKKMTPLSNLYVEMLNRMGIPTTKFGDSTGGLAHLA